MKQKMQDFDERCPLCLDRFTLEGRQPMLFGNCKHAACSECLDMFYARPPIGGPRRRRCPICQSPCNLEKPVRYQPAEHMIQEMRLQVERNEAENRINQGDNVRREQGNQIAQEPLVIDLTQAARGRGRGRGRGGQPRQRRNQQRALDWRIVERGGVRRRGTQREQQRFDR